jgi:hypothetical protein
MEAALAGEYTALEKPKNTPMIALILRVFS